MTIHTLPGGVDLPEDHPASGPHCGVTAVAVLAKISFTQAWAEICKLARYPVNWKGSTPDPERLLILASHGVRLTAVPCKRMALGRWTARYCQRDTTYLVVTTGHIQIVRNGMATDQTGVRLVAGSQAARKLVKTVRIVRWPVRKKLT